MKNLLKEKMDKGQKCVGPFTWLGGANTVEAIAFTGADYVIIDTEHGPFDVESALTMIRAAESRGLTPCARVKDSSRNSVLKMLDAGAEALIIPNIRSVEEVKDLVSYGKYFPIGERGVAQGRKSGYGNASWAEEKGLTGYFEVCNREQLLIPQCETAECLDKIEEIVNIEGIDGIFIGPYDLSSALKAPGQFDTPKFNEALERIYKAVLSSGKYLFVYAGSKKDAERYLSMGCHALTYSTDSNFLIQAMSEAYREILGK